MSLDPEQLAAAIKRNDAVAVRELLRDATEADRQACAKALRRLLADPHFNQVAGIPFGGPDGTELIRGGSLAASGPALLFPRKSVATAQLKLVGKIAAGQPSVRGPALAAAARAFGHQRLDIQEAALGLIARYDTPAGPERLAISELAASLAPGLAPEAVALGLLPRPTGRHVEILRPAPSEPATGKPLPPPLDDPARLAAPLLKRAEKLDRLASWTAGSPPRHDLEIALLRLTPGVDDSFWSAWAQVHPSSMRAAQRAYRPGLAPLRFEPEVGPPGPPPLFAGPGRPDSLVLARITEPPAETTGSRRWALLAALSSPLRDFYKQYGQRWQVTSSYQAVVAGLPLLCPWQPELAAAHLLRPLSEGLRPGSTWAGTAATAARGLSGSGRPLGEIGHLALLTGLASAEPYVRIAAAEVWAEALRDGRLDPGLAASAIVTGVTRRAFKLNRVADGLRHASHEPAAGRQIAETVSAAADGLIPAKPANLHLLFELVARWAPPPSGRSRPARSPGSWPRKAAAASRPQPATSPHARRNPPRRQRMVVATCTLFGARCRNHDIKGSAQEG